jgi:hypothetical protein
MDRDDGTDWDAAFEAIVASLRPSRPVRMSVLAGQAILAVVLMALACWMILQLIAEPLRQLGRPWV